MKSLTAVRKKSPNYPVEFKIKMVELSHRPEISVAQLAREHGINDNLLFKWRQYWREGKLRPPSTTENNVPELAVRKKSPNYPVEFKIKMVELSHRPEISVAQLAREHGINDNLLFKWRQYWREGKLRPPSTTENNVPELLPITLDAEDVVPTTSPRSQPVAAATPESLNISCEVTFRHGSLRLNGAISENILNLLIRELKR
ncbi:IS66-like element accessory protein TnpA [Escherichia coli]|uniref:IS66-like element accessory protein TnpA n=2 Tax=Escherichia coli TaxID=562 RepID=UPI00131EFF8E|nr:transposase [Escherichia coli]